MKPKLSYTIWFTQRTGSSLLCKALEATGVAGVPGEWLYEPNMPEDYKAMAPEQLQEHIWNAASTGNGVLGIKHSFHEPAFSQLIEILRRLPTCPRGETNRVGIWENAFPNHHHIFMTRRNKVRLAVSWWKAVQSREWHIRHGERPKAIDLSNAYSFDAIRNLCLECFLRESGIQEFFTEGNIVPLTIVYEDFVQHYEKTIRAFLNYLDIEHQAIEIPAPYFSPTADDISEEWVQRFRHQIQQGWRYRGW